jgi:hypothetical protein
MQLIKIKHLRPRPLDLGENSQGLGHREGIVRRNGPARPQPCWKVGGWIWLVLELHRACRPPRRFSHTCSAAGYINNVARTLHMYVLSVVSFMSAGKRRKLRLIEGNKKCRHLCRSPSLYKGSLKAGVYPSETQNPLPRPPNTMYVYVSTVYLFTQGRRGELNHREGQRGNSSQSWVENTNMTDCISSL